MEFILLYYYCIYTVLLYYYINIFYCIFYSITMKNFLQQLKVQLGFAKSFNAYMIRFLKDLQGIKV